MIDHVTTWNETFIIIFKNIEVIINIIFFDTSIFILYLKQYFAFTLIIPVQFSSVTQLCWPFATPWIAACQASLSITNSQCLLKLISIESVMPSNHLILCSPLLLLPSIFPSIRVFSNESAVRIRWPKYWNFSSASVLPKSIQGWFPLALTGLISLLSKGLSRVISSTTVWKHQFFSALPSLQFNSHARTWLLEKTIAFTIWTFVSKVMSVLFILFLNYF